ncbi:MAG: hypothetical protein KDB94_04845 [Acidobacteria bacterium]|nr:hypothetical protein [Acidobacteriota bacterium]
MICPACGEDYEADQVARCPWCGGPGGVAETDAEEEGLGALVRLLEVRDDAELAAATAALERAEIPFFVQAGDPLRALDLSALLRGESVDDERREILVPESLLAGAASALGLRREEG